MPRDITTEALAKDAVDDLLKGRQMLTATVSGSALYGTASANSDDDLRCVFLPTRVEILTGKASFGLDSNKANKRLGAGDVDVAGVSLMRYLGLLGKMDMISTEMLFASRSAAARIGDLHPVFDLLWEAREKLVAGNSNSAIGHARQRIGAFFPSDDASLDAVRAAHEIMTSIAGDRLIDEMDKVARLAAIDGVDVVAVPADRFTPTRGWSDLTEEERSTGLAASEPLFVVVAGKKIGLTNPLREAIRVVERPLNRDAENKRIASRGENIAWKDAYQGVRLIHQAIDLHETRELIFPRPEAPLLRKIRAGEMTPCELKDAIAEAMDRLRLAEERYPFRTNACEDTTLEIICEAHEAVVRS